MSSAGVRETQRKPVRISARASEVPGSGKEKWQLISADGGIGVLGTDTRFFIRSSSGGRSGQVFAARGKGLRVPVVFFGFALVLRVKRVGLNGDQQESHNFGGSAIWRHIQTVLNLDFKKAPW